MSRRSSRHYFLFDVLDEGFGFESGHQVAGLVGERVPKLIDAFEAAFGRAFRFQYRLFRGGECGLDCFLLGDEPFVIPAVPFFDQVADMRT